MHWQLHQLIGRICQLSCRYQMTRMVTDEDRDHVGIFLAAILSGGRDVVQVVANLMGSTLKKYEVMHGRRQSCLFASILCVYQMVVAQHAESGMEPFPPVPSCIYSRRVHPTRPLRHISSNEGDPRVQTGSSSKCGQQSFPLHPAALFAGSSPVSRKPI